MSPCFEAVWRAFAGDQTRALMPVTTLRSHRADGTLFYPPPEQGHHLRKKATVQPPPQQPPMGRQLPAPVAMWPPPSYVYKV